MAVILTAALLTPFPAHTGTELEAWGQDWAQRSVDNLSVDLMAEWRDMRGRHEWFFDPQPTVTVGARVIPDLQTFSPSTKSGVEQWRDLVAHFWPAEHVDPMLRILSCESHGIPTAVNPSSGATGLFQIMPFWQKIWPGDYLDPWTNAAVAYQIWLEQGYGAWVCKA